MCEYFLLIPIDVPSFKLIEGKIKELQGVEPNTLQAENDQKSPGRIGLKGRCVRSEIVRRGRRSEAVVVHLRART